jgi:hypothetical protein
MQQLASSSCTQRTPAGFPFGIPGIGEEIDGAMQQAPQPGRQVAWLIKFVRSAMPLHAQSGECKHRTWKKNTVDFTDIRVIHRR